MTWRASIIGLLSMTAGLAPAANAQDALRQIRFITASGVGDHRWQGYIERLTPDSLHVRVRGTDTVAAFSRAVVRSVERERESHPGRAAGIGCLAVGTALGALGYFGTNDPDSPGLEKVAGVLGLGVGCALGAVGGVIVSAVRSRGWEPWLLPDSMPSIVPRDERSS
jgi:hypothetical protein